MVPSTSTPGPAQPGLAFRPLVPADQDRLWHWLHVALWDPPPAGLRPIEVLQAPPVRIYAEHWGRPSDVGVVAQVDGIDAGACWMRLLPTGVGLAFVDEATPQLGIALEPPFQHRGHGRPLMLAALDAARSAGYRQVALTVHPENPAQAMYERCGFRRVERRNGFHLMVALLGQERMGESARAAGWPALSLADHQGARMFDQAQNDLAKNLWEQSRAAARQAHDAWDMVMKSQKTLMDSMRSAGPAFALAADQYDKLMEFHSKQYKAALDHMDKMSAEYLQALGQRKK